MEVLDGGLGHVNGLVTLNCYYFPHYEVTVQMKRLKTGIKPPP